MPFPNEHACRIRDPSGFQKGSFRRIKEGRLSIIIGRLKGKKTTTTQSFRYPKASWEESEARSHCKDHKGRFEAASGSKDMTDQQAEIVSIVPMGAMSFNDVEEHQLSEEVVGRIGEISRQLETLSFNILSNKDADKEALFKVLIGEMEERLVDMTKDFTKKQSIVEKVKGLIVSETEPEQTEQTSSIIFWKEGDRYRFMAIYSNNYRDEDVPPEILAEVAHERFMKEVEAGMFPYPELWHWHIPGTKWGQSDWLHYDKDTGFMMASGYVDKGHEAEADSIIESDEIVKVSHGMPSDYIERDKEDETIITRYVSQEISDLPAEVAANQLTGFTIFKEVDMSIPDDKKEYLRKRGLDDTAIAEIEGDLDDKAKLAMEAGLEKKEAEVEVTEPIEEPKEEPEGETEEPAESQYATREEVAEAITEVVTPIVEMVQTTQELVKQLAKSDEKKIEEKVADTPKESIASIVARGLSIIGKEETKMDKRTREAKDGPKETDPEPQITGVPFIDKMLSEERKE